MANNYSWGGFSYPSTGSMWPYYGIGQGSLGSPQQTGGFNYPTPQEAYNSIYTMPHMAAQQGILNQLGDMNSFRSAVLPEMQGVMKTLGRSGIPSSSWSDRAITESMGGLYNKWLWNALQGYQNMGAQMPGMMSSYYSPYSSMMGLIGY